MNYNDNTRNQEVELLSDIIYNYNRNHLEYNRNMNNVFSMIQNFLERNSEVREPRENRRNRETFRETNNRRHNNRSSLFNSSPFFTFANIPTNTMNTTNNTGLTNQQIENSTEIIPYSTEMRDVQCPISFEDFVVGEDVLKIIFCGHIFKPESVRNWFRRNKRCPVCRHDLTSHTVTPPPVREINIDISLNRIPRLPLTTSLPNRRIQNNEIIPLNDIENSIVENINRIFQNVSIPEENRELENILSRYIFEFPIYFDISNNPN